MGCSDMNSIGFSTGALARGDFRSALNMLSSVETDAVELSALRDHELVPLMAALSGLDLKRFRYVSIHVPSKFKTMPERAIAAALTPCVAAGLPIVIHPDAIYDPDSWACFGPLLCIENMDKRKWTGRTVAELTSIFSTFPNATFCLDIAHARQIDPTMAEAREMLARFGPRLRQLHISEIDSVGHHNRLSLASILATQGLAEMIPDNIPAIIESMVPEHEMKRELNSVRTALKTDADAVRRRWASQDWGEMA